MCIFANAYVYVQCCVYMSFFKMFAHNCCVCALCRMISKAVNLGADPLSLLRPPDVHSPASVRSDAAYSPGSSDLGRSCSKLTSSFVFVEKSSPALCRQATVVTQPVVMDLLPNEEKQALMYNVSYCGDDVYTLFVSNYRIMLIPPTEAIPELEIPLTSILDIKEKRLQNNFLNLDIKTKDCRFFQFVCSSPVSVLKLLNELVFGKHFFADLQHSTNVPDAVHVNVSEFERMSLCERFELNTTINRDFLLCETYPRVLVFPKNVSEEVLFGSAKFRDKSRLPVFSYVGGGGAIFRSSQPKSSILNRSVHDETLMKLMNIEYIIDCRPMLNAYANIANGAGVESLGNYHSGIELWFASIPNIHTVRDSWEKMFLLSQQLPTTGWYTGLEQTGWYDHISLVLRASSVLMDQVTKGKNVLCRCSHGLDRTPQVVSLAMLGLDPYYRTIQGFATLIQKEWISMGHRFATRFSLGTSPTDETSPIFFQFLESVFQLMTQNPTAFQFNEDYLVAILHQGVLSCRFDTFLYDCEKDGFEKKSKKNECWDTIWQHCHLFTNRSYINQIDDNPLTIEFHISQMRIFTNIWLKTKRTRI